MYSPIVVLNIAFSLPTSNNNTGMWRRKLKDLIEETVMTPITYYNKGTENSVVWAHYAWK